MTRTKTTQISFRLPIALVERLDHAVGAWRTALPGVRMTRTDLVRVLLEGGLEAGLAEPPGGHPRGR